MFTIFMSFYLWLLLGLLAGVCTWNPETSGHGPLIIAFVIILIWAVGLHYFMTSYF